LRRRSEGWGIRWWDSRRWEGAKLDMLFCPVFAFFLFPELVFASCGCAKWSWSYSFFGQNKSQRC
jgi:hypothetical protein